MERSKTWYAALYALVMGIVMIATGQICLGVVLLTAAAVLRLVD